MFKSAINLIKPVFRPVKRWVVTQLDLLNIRKLNNKYPHAEEIACALRLVYNHHFNSGKELMGVLEKERELMLTRNELLVDDTLVSEGLYDRGVTLAQACSVSKPPKWCLLLYQLIREIKPLNVIELGTNLGISSAYQAMALDLNGQNGQLITLEDSPYRLRVARNLHTKIGLKNVTYVQGLFGDVLDSTLKKIDCPIDFAFIDGHHQYEPTLQYFDVISKYLSEDAIVVFDDIRWSQGMRRAWEEILADERVGLAVDLYSVGVCIVTQEAHQSDRAFVGPMKHVIS